jgi:hypothetical protein
VAEQGDGRERRETGSIMGSEWGRIDKHSRGGAALLQRCLGLGCLDAWMLGTAPCLFSFNKVRFCRCLVLQARQMLLHDASHRSMGFTTLGIR